MVVLQRKPFRLLDVPVADLEHEKFVADLIVFKLFNFCACFAHGFLL